MVLPKGRLSRLASIGKMATQIAVEAGKAQGARALGKAKERAMEEIHERTAEQLAKTLGSMKGLPMKLGQMLSYIDEIIPVEHRPTYRKALAALRAQAPTIDVGNLERFIREEVSDDAWDAIASIEPAPIAAASIGQVFKGRLKSGDEIAIKIQYPGIEDSIRSDLKNIDALAQVLSLVLPRVELERTLEDLSSRILEECDYVLEAQNQYEFRARFLEEPRVIVPKVFTDLSSRRVLVSEFASGMSWAEALQEPPQMRTLWGQTIFRFVFRSLYIGGMFNADPHPGNYLFRKHGAVVFLDFGCVQRYNDGQRQGFRRVRDALLSGKSTHSIRHDMIDAYGLPTDLDEEDWNFLDGYLKLSLEPLLFAQPYQYTREYTERLWRMTTEGGRIGLRKVFKKGIQESSQPGFIFLNRINFGLSTILADLGAQADWRVELENTELARPGS